MTAATAGGRGRGIEEHRRRRSASIDSGFACAPLVVVRGLGMWKSARCLQGGIAELDCGC